MHLTDKAFARLRDVFRNRGHRPSFSENLALRDIQETLSLMAYGSARQVYYLSELDPGVGKSTATATWIKTFVEEDDLADVGVIVCCDRYDEIVQYLETMDLDEDQYAVLVAKGHELNSKGLGRERINEARILLTTKEQLRRRTRKRRFAETSEFFYRNAPRSVRIWDEEFLAGHPISIPRWSLGRLVAAFSHHEPLRSFVKQTMDSLEHYETGDIFFVDPLPVDHSEIDTLCLDLDEEDAELARDFCYLAGRPVTIRATEVQGNSTLVLVDTVNTIPEDFKPCLITDASGRVRYTYRLQEEERGDLIRLKSGTKDYSNLNCFLVDMASGKNAYLSNDYWKIAKEVANIIDSRPSEDFLVIHHNVPKRYRRDMQRAILGRVKSTSERTIEFLPWGKHTATNRFRDIDNTIIAGLLTYSPPQCEAIGRAAAGRPTFKGPFTDPERNLVSIGEVAHNLFQASCRSSIRKNVDGKCPHSNLWVVASSKSGIQKLLADMFPGCRVIPWKVSALDEKAQAAYEYLKEAKTRGFDEIPFRDVWKKAGYRDGTNLFRAYRRTPELRSIIEDLGYVVMGEGRHRRFVLYSINSEAS